MSTEEVSELAVKTVERKEPITPLFIPSHFRGVFIFPEPPTPNLESQSGGLFITARFCIDYSTLNI